MCALTLQQGEIARAIAHGKAAVKTYPDAPDCWNNLGAALRRNGEIDAAQNAFETALKADPGHGDAGLNLAGLLAESGSFQSAADACQQVLAAAPENTRALFLLGNILQATGDTAGARNAWQSVTRIEPKRPESWINLVASHADSGDHASAHACFEAALKAGIRSADLYANMARADLARGETENAVALANSGLSLDGGHIGCATVLAAARLELGDAPGSEKLARQVCDAAPDLAEIRIVLGGALERQRRNDEAIDAYEAARNLAPDSTEALASLADLYEHTNDLAKAQAMVDLALEQDPGHAVANRVAACLMRRQGNIEGAIEKLTPVAGPPAPPRVKQGVFFELGRLHDRAGNAARAFEYFAQANRIQRDHPASRAHDPARYRADIARMCACLTPEWVSSWTAPAPAPDDTPVFLVGFPRSGTTLLDQILDSHPDIQVAEEKPMMELLKRDVARRTGSFPEGIAQLSTGDIAELRALYWSHAAEFVSREPNSIFVDKLPLNIEKTPLIHRVFPDAKFILMLRHPADCVFSCFMQSFRPNIAMNNFHTVEDAARIYDMAFGLWEKANACLDLNVHTLRYEDLVSDLEPTVAQLLAFLEVPWDAGVLDYAENSRRRGRINTPSYNQVTEPIHTRARGRWVRYRDHMSEPLKTLSPWIDSFGYEGPDGPGTKTG